MLPDGPNVPREELLEIFKTNPFPFLRDCYAKYGSMFSLDLGVFNYQGDSANGKWVFCAEPDILQKMASDKGDALRAGVSNQIVFGIAVGPQGSLGIDGPVHRMHRRLLMKPLHGDRMKVYTETQRRFAEEAVARWQVGDEINIYYDLQTVTVETIITTVFGFADDAETRALCRKVVVVERAGTTLEELQALFAELETLIRAKIQAARANPAQHEGRTDVFSLLVNARDDDGTQLSEDELHDELITMLLAGFGTTATMLSWAFAVVLKHPTVLARVLEEINTEIGDDEITSQNIDRLRYTEAVVKETLRFCPMFWAAGTRVAFEDVALGEYRIPAGTSLVNCSYLLHLREDLYPKADHFEPERFLTGKFKPNEWAPFGFGIRRCIGMHFALHEMKVIIATILSRVEFKLLTPELEPEWHGVFFGPKGGPGVKITAKK